MGTRSRKIWILCLIPMCYALYVCPCYADGGLFSIYAEDILTPSQKGFIAYDNGVETLIIQTNFRGESAEFGWVIPVPSKPELSEADDEIFLELHGLTQPEIREEHHFGCFGLSDDGAYDNGPGFDEDVTIISRETVGIYETTTLSATDPGALADWLNENGYYMPPMGEQIARSYVDAGWHFVAMKIRRSVDERDVSGEGGLQPVSLKFSSDEIVYPMKLTAVSADYIDLLLYVLSDHKVWYHDAEIEFADWIRPPAPIPLLEGFVKKKMYLTKLRSYESLRDLSRLDDIHLHRYEDDDTYREVIYVRRQESGVDICLVSCCLLFLFMGRRRGSEI